MSEQTLPTEPQHRVEPAHGAGAPARPGAAPPRWRRPGVIGAIVAVLVVLALIVVLVWQGSDDDDVTTDTSAPVTETTADEPATTAAPATEAPATTVAPDQGVDRAAPVYPFVDSDVRFDDPVALATAFATDWVGFTDPVVGELMQGDSRSGEIEVRPVADGPATTVLVRQLGPGNSWWVIGAVSGNIAVDQPAANTAITSPVTVTGRALGFEGNVVVEVRQDQSVEPIGSGTVTGGGDEMRPFEGQIAFSEPTQGYGALVFTTHSGMDGSVWEASVIRVQFG